MDQPSSTTPVRGPDVLVITTATGPFRVMTEEWLRTLHESAGRYSGKVHVSVHLGGFESKKLSGSKDNFASYICSWEKKNAGFAAGMQKALVGANRWDWDYVITVNNDVVFKDTSWMTHLFEGDEEVIRVPLNTVCNQKAVVSKGPKKKDPFYLSFVPAVCWAVPKAWCLEMHSKHGFYIFDPQFKVGWHEDVYAALLFRRLRENHQPFKVMPKSWVFHRGSQTVHHMIAKSGDGFTKDNMRLYWKKIDALKMEQD